MREKVFVVTATAGGTTYSPAYPVDSYAVPCNIALGVKILGVGSAVYDVQHTFDDPGTVNLSISSNGTWFPHATLTSGTANNDSNYAFPIKAIRMALRAAASATATLYINQAGPIG